MEDPVATPGPFCPLLSSETDPPFHARTRRAIRRPKTTMTPVTDFEHALAVSETVSSQYFSRMWAKFLEESTADPTIRIESRHEEILKPVFESVPQERDVLQIHDHQLASGQMCRDDCQVHHATIGSIKQSCGEPVTVQITDTVSEVASGNLNFHKRKKLRRTGSAGAMDGKTSPITQNSESEH